MRGLFVTFEGIEGSGKTTLVQEVAGTLRRSGLDPFITREPGGTFLGAALRRVLLNPETGEINPVTELMLFAADRAQHVSRVIRPAVDQGRIVLCDRFSDATAAYQGYGRGLPLEAIAVIDQLVTTGLKPDMTVLLDLPVEVGLNRARTRNDESASSGESRIDDEDTVFHQRVRDGYLEVSAAGPERFLILDATKRPERLAEMVVEKLRTRFPHVF